jgi:ComF family protein
MIVPIAFKPHQHLWQWLGARCVLCHEPGHANAICPACQATLPRNNPACCYCGQASLATVCAPCAQSPPNHCVIAAFRFSKPVNQFIHQLKFSPSLLHAKLCATLLTPSLQDHYAQRPFPEVIIPVPLARQRLRQRGFNQSTEIAKILAKHFDTPLDHALCTRVRHTQAQAKLSKQQRQRNVAKAFVVKPNSYQHIALLDDVVTTGSTVSEISNRCMATGISKVDVWAVARAQ